MRDRSARPTRHALLAARGALLVALVLAGCGAEATPTPVPAPGATVIPAQTAPPATAPTARANVPPAVGTVGAGEMPPVGTAPPRLVGGDQPLPTTSPGVVAKPPTAPPGT